MFLLILFLIALGAGVSPSFNGWLGHPLALTNFLYLVLVAAILTRKGA